jgi:hypothetical protein
MRTFSQKQNQPQKQVSSSLARSNMATPGPALREHPILHLQRTIGNQAVLRMLQTHAEGAEEPGVGLTAAASPRFGHDFSRIPIHPPTAGAIQTKLAINKPGDQYEQEADHISEQVMRKPEPQLQRACPCGGGCPKCQTEQPGREHESLQTKRVQASDTGQIAAPPIVHEVLRSPGQPLDPATRAFMEPRFGHDFSRVRVHSGAAAEQSAQDVNAHAYTVGQNMVFGAGRFAPGTREGRRLIAHELTHVAQQNVGMTVVQRAPADDTRSSRDESTARHRGQLMAKRIRNHGKLSTEARAKINRDLAYFEGAAKEAYLKEVRPALLAVTEIEMPAEQVVPRAPRPIGLSLLADDPRRIMTDEEIYAPLTEAKKNEDKEEARLKEAQINELRDKTKDWGADQAFALNLLRPLLRYSTHVDPRAVSDHIHQPILDRLLKWLKDGDKERLDACAANDPGRLAKIRGKFGGDEPCVSWFDTSKVMAHGPSELAELGRLLDLDRKLDMPAVNKVYQGVLEYRYKTDPYWLKMRQEAERMVGAAVVVVGAVGEGMPAAVERTEELPAKTTPAPEPPAPTAPKPPVTDTPPVVTKPPSQTKGGGGPTPKPRPTVKPTPTKPPEPGKSSDIAKDVDQAFKTLPEADPHSGATKDPKSQIRSGVMIGGEPQPKGQARGGIPASKDPKAGPPEVLDVGAGVQKPNLGLPPERQLVAVTRSDVREAAQPDVILDATQPIPKNLQGRFTTLIINNPYGYKANIGAMKQALGPDGKIIVQGNWEANKYFRELGTSPVPPNMTRTIERNLPPSAILGEGFRTSSGNKPVQPNARITFDLTNPTRVYEPAVH